MILSRGLIWDSKENSSIDNVIYEFVDVDVVTIRTFVAYTLVRSKTFQNPANLSLKKYVSLFNQDHTETAFGSKELIIRGIYGTEYHL